MGVEQIGSRQKPVDLVHAQIRRQALTDFRRFQIFRRVHADQFLHHRVLEKTAQRNQIPRHGAAVQFFLVQTGKKIDDVFAVHLRRSVFVALGQKGGKSLQVPPIGKNRILRQALLDAQVAQENVDGRIHHG